MTWQRRLIHWTYNRRRQAFILIVLALLPIITFTDRSIQEGGFIEFLVDGAGAFLVGAGVLLRVWATAHVGGKKRRELIKAGPFRLTRNPLYLGTLLATTGIFLLLERWMATIAALFIVALWYYLIILKEEEGLSERFGQPFRDYCISVPRLVGMRSLFSASRAWHDPIPSDTSRFVYREIRTVCLAFVLVAVQAEYFEHFFHLLFKG